MVSASKVRQELEVKGILMTTKHIEIVLKNKHIFLEEPYTNTTGYIKACGVMVSKLALNEIMSIIEKENK